MGDIQFDLIAAYFNYISLIGSWINPVTMIFRNLFLFFDAFIYSLIPITYMFCIILASVDMFVNQEKIIKGIASSIYSLLAVVMLFKLAFSLLVLMTDPDKIEDKEKGAAKLFTNVIVCLILILAVPSVFSAAGALQDAILGIKRDTATGVVTPVRKPLIEKIFFKGNAEDWCSGTVNPNTGEAVCPDLGTFMSKAVLSSFLTITPDTVANPGTTKPSESTNEAVKAYSDVFNSVKVNFFSLFGYINNETSFAPGNSADLPEELGVYTYSYIFLLSTIAGGFTLWIFISLAIDIAYRSIKLFALKLIAPIPIISYMDSNSQTKGVFKKWVDETVKTYLSLFIRLATLSIAAFILKSINWTPTTYAGDDLNPNTSGMGAIVTILNPYIRMFFILGILTFMKTAPKLFENIFGYTGKTKEESFGQNLVKGLMGGAAAGAVGAISGGISAKRHGYNGLLGAAVGGFNAAKGGVSSGFNGKLGGFGKALIAGPGSTAKYFGYNPLGTSIKKKAEEAKGMAIDKDYMRLRGQNDLSSLGYENMEDDKFLDSGLTVGEKADYNALIASGDEAKKRQMRIGKENAAFADDRRNKLNDRIRNAKSDGEKAAAEKELNKFNADWSNLKEEGKYNYKRSYGKRMANAEQFESVDKVLGKQLNKKLEMESDCDVQEAIVTKRQDVVMQAQVTWQQSIGKTEERTDPVTGVKTTVDLGALAKLDLDKAIADRDVEAENLKAKKALAGKADEVFKGMLDSEEHARGTTFYKQRDKGGQLN